MDNQIARVRPGLAAIAACALDLPSALAAPPYEFLFTQQKVVSLRTPNASVALDTRFTRDALEAALPGYDLGFAAEIEGWDEFYVERNGQHFLTIVGSIESGGIMLIWGAEGVIDGSGVSPGMPLTEAYTNRAAKCQSGMYASCESEFSRHLHYLIEWPEDCPADIRQWEIDNEETQLLPCIEITELELSASSLLAEDYGNAEGCKVQFESDRAIRVTATEIQGWENTCSLPADADLSGVPMTLECSGEAETWTETVSLKREGDDLVYQGQHQAFPVLQLPHASERRHGQGQVTQLWLFAVLALPILRGIMALGSNIGALAVLWMAGFGSDLAFASRAEFSICDSGPRITCIVDGDTVWFEGVKYRFEEIDTPEKGAVAECMPEGLQANRGHEAPSGNPQHKRVHD